MWKKISVIGGAFLLVIGLVTSGFVIEDRYTNESHHETDLKHEREVTSEKMNNLENQIVMNLKEFSVEQKAQRKRDEYQYYSNELDKLDQRIRELERYERANPADQGIKNDLRYYRDRRNKIRQKLDMLMSN